MTVAARKMVAPARFELAFTAPEAVVLGHYTRGLFITNLKIFKF